MLKQHYSGKLRNYRRQTAVSRDEGRRLMDAFDTFWRCANKPLEDHATTISVELHHAVTLLPEADWHDRETKRSGRSFCC
jgi:hypothetical protein